MMGYPATFLNNGDREIIEGLQTGNHKKRNEELLFNRYFYFIQEGIKKYGLLNEDAFDAYSDTILAAIDKISTGTFEGKSSLKTYLYQIFNNKCVDLLRKKSTNKSSIHKTEAITDLLLYISDTARSIVQKLIDKADWHTLMEKLNGLEGKCKQLLLLWADRYSDKESKSRTEEAIGNPDCRRPCICGRCGFLPCSNEIRTRCCNRGKARKIQKNI
jgi:RNA polymerase sigma-70 factor (ECF subfamily)